MTPLSAEQSQVVALEALGWLIANDELLPVFLGASGASIDDIKTSAADVGFQSSVLDFLMMDDEWVLACTASMNRKPDSLMRARAGLPGAGEVHWT